MAEYLKGPLLAQHHSKLCHIWRSIVDPSPEIIANRDIGAVVMILWEELIHMHSPARGVSFFSYSQLGMNNSVFVSVQSR